MKEIQKYPYNAIIGEENKIFLSDQVCKQVVKITYRNGQIFCTIKDRITSKKKEIMLSAAVIFGALFGMPREARPIGVPPRLPSAPEISRPAPQHFHQHAPTINPRVDKIIMITNNKMIPLIYINGHYSYINQQLLKKLRAGDLTANITVVVIGAIIYIMCQVSGVDAFAILSELGRLNAPTPNLGFAPAPSSSSTEIALVPTQAQEFNDMSLMFNEPKTKFSFVMTRDEALKLIEETYPGQLEITDNKRFSDWQAAKKIYHANDFGINPEDYGMTKYNIMRLNRIGLTKYIREGRPLPPIKLVKDYQMAVKNMYDHAEHFDGKFSSRGEQKIHETSYSYNESTRQVAGFNKETGDIITAGKYSPRAFDRFLDTKHLGRL
jgi:hypothetical protein